MMRCTKGTRFHAVLRNGSQSQVEVTPKTKGKGWEGFISITLLTSVSHLLHLSPVHPFNFTLLHTPSHSLHGTARSLHAPCTLHARHCTLSSRHFTPLARHCTALHAPCTALHAPCTALHAPCMALHAPCTALHGTARRM